MTLCPLRFLADELGWPSCSTQTDLHHVLNKSFLKGNKEALKLVEGKYRHLFMVRVCTHHNRERYADAKVARAYLLLQHHRDEVEPALEEIAACFTGGYPECNWEGLTEMYRKHVQETRA